jgi:hypothetical protein
VYGMRGQQCETCGKQEDLPATDCAHPFPDPIGETRDGEAMWRCDECESVYVAAPPERR